MNRWFNGLWFEKKKRIIWTLIFIFLFFCSIDMWNWNKTYPLYFGLPSWLVYHVILTIFVGLFFFVFTIHVWEDE